MSVGFGSLPNVSIDRGRRRKKASRACADRRWKTGNGRRGVPVPPQSSRFTPGFVTAPFAAESNIAPYFASTPVE